MGNHHHKVGARGSATLILRIRWITSRDTEGRPCGWRLFQLQYSRNPRRCHAMTVSGLTITRADRQPLHSRESLTQRSRSATALCESGSSVEGPRVDAGGQGSLTEALPEFQRLAESNKGARERSRTWHRQVISMTAQVQPAQSIPSFW